MTFLRKAAATLAGALLASACGLKAPLVLPSRPAPVASPSSAPDSTGQPVPAPAATPLPCPADRSGSGDEPECTGRTPAS